MINAIWVYNLTVKSGHFDVLRRSFEKVSPDQRIQAIIIAFCFGALLEALAGFGTPVAITVVMLMALGFQPLKAAAVALIANTAPVAYGALATPIVTLAEVTSTVSDDPGLTVENLGAMVGRQTPLLAIFVPLVLVFVVDGKRGVKQTWLVALVGGVAFGIGQFIAANYISVPLADIIAALVSALAIVALVRVWSPSQIITAADMRDADETAGESGGSAVGAGASRHRWPWWHGDQDRADARRQPLRRHQGLRAVPRDHRDLLLHQHPGRQGVLRRPSRGPSPSPGRGWTSSTPPATRWRPSTTSTGSPPPARS